MTKQTIEHSGFQYDVAKIAEYVEAGMPEKQAVREAHPTVPAKSVAPILAKVRRHPYYLARKEARLAILENKGPELQQNLLDLAFNARSEMVRANTTINALDRVYGNQAADDAEKPTFVFNFSFGNPTGQPPEPVQAENTVIDQDA